MKKITMNRFSVIVILLFISSNISAQISGPSVVLRTTTETYYIESGYSVSDWAVSGGNIMSQNSNSITINWTVTGGGIIHAAGYYMGSNFTVDNSVVVNPAVPPIPTTTVVGCGFVTLEAIPPSGEEFFWQVSSQGYDTSDSSITKTFNTGGPYFIRARSTYNGTWSNIRGMNIEINDGPDASFNYNTSSFCTSETNPTPTITGLSGGSFLSFPSGLSINATTGTINIGSSTIGSYNVVYQVSDGTCSNSSVQNIEITGGSDASFNYGAGSYCSTEIDPTPTIMTSGGIFSGFPVGLGINTSTGKIDLSASTEGTYTITYTTAGGCPNSSNQVVTINSKPPTPTVTTPINYTVGDTASSLTATGTNLLWYTAALGGSGSSTALIPNTSTSGIFYFYVSQTIDCESDRKEIIVNVNSVNCALTAPLKPIEISADCTSLVLQRNGTPPDCVTWYWQTSSTGTSTTLGSGEFYTTTLSSGLFYLRARDNSTGEWSASSPYEYVSGNSSGTTWYIDIDGDLYYDSTSIRCTRPSGGKTISEVIDSGDCNDNNALINPGATEICGDGVDNNCNGQIDECGNPGAGGSNYNYIYTISPQMPMETILNELDDDNLQRNITYFDGLGRPMQNIAIAQGGNKEDVITHIGYDEIGRQDKDYLPYTDYGNTKNYRNINPEGATLQYYNTNFGTELDLNDPNPFSQKDFEASPLNRVLKQAAPGKDWKLGNGNEIEFDYQTNSINEVRWFEVSLGTDYTPTLEQGTSQYYPANKLYKTITRDENHTGTSKNHTTEEFKDKQGKVILKRTYADINSVSTAHDTYYIYDDYGNLTFVLPPKMEASPNTTTLATIVSQLNELGYQYQYDYRNRLVEKTIPGKGIEYIVYDKLDRSVLTQDAVQRMASKWLFTKYDVFSRVAYTGVYINISSRVAMQQLVDEKTTIQTTTSSSAPTPVTLQNSVGVNLSGTTISRTASHSDWTSAYFTTNQSVLGNGSIEFVASDVQFIKIGLDTSNNNTSYTGVDYSMEVVASNDSSPIKINENWITKTPIDNTYSAGDILKIERIETTVYYKKNDVVIYTSLTPSTGELYGNGFIYTNMFGIQNLTITNNNPVEISILENTLFESRTTVNDINGTPIYYDNSAFPSVVSESAPIVTTTYTDLVGVSVNGTTVTKTGSTSWSNARFATVEGVTKDGYLQFPITVNSKEIRIGLDISNSGVAYNAIDYSIRVKSTGGLTIYENSTYKSSVSSYSVGDIIKIERVGNTVYYKLNDVTFYTSAIGSTGTLYGNCSLYTSTAKVQDVKIYNEGAAASLGLEVLTINYYDDYDFGVPAIPLNRNYTDPITTRTKGLATGSKVKVLGQTNNWITTTSYYDDKARPIYSHSNNEYLGTTDIVESKLDFVGKANKVKTIHSKGQSTIETEDTFVYDHAGRLKSQTQTINGVNQETIVANTYDELGQLASKGVGGKIAQTRLQTVDYNYNIRGWLKNINNDVNNDNDLFDFKINYNTVDHLGTALFNGNIAETEWKTQNDNVLRWYKYEYDALNRLTNAVDNLGKLNETLNYDKNGNINNLVRLGHVVGGSTIPDINNPLHFGTMDNLTYSYVTNSNKLAIVSDAGNDIFGFKDDQIGTGTDITTDYTYDANGNMLTDANKGIINIGYNHLNLPSQVTFAADKYIDYIYDATGVKLEKVVTEGTAVTRTKYAGNYIYEEATGTEELKFFNHPEGYIEPTEDVNKPFQYVYRYTDIWGNTRITYADDNNDGVITASSEIRREQNYYPFGLEHKGYNNVLSGVKNNLKTYQGQEFTDDLGLNTHEWKYRISDPSIGRFWQIDPLAMDYPYNSTYAFQENKLGIGTELEGLEVKLHEWLDDDSKLHRDYSTEIKIANNSNASIKDVIEYSFEIANSISSNFSGIDSDGNIITTSVKLNFSNDKKLNESDYGIEFTNQVTDSNGANTIAEGRVDKIGDSQSNRMQIIIPGYSGSTYGEPVSRKGMASTGAHEYGHTLGLRHQVGNTNKSENGVTVGYNNLMRKSNTEARYTNGINSEQLSAIRKELKYNQIFSFFGRFKNSPK